MVKNSNKSLPQCIRGTLCFMWVNRRSVWVALWQQRAAPLPSAVEKRHKSNDNDGLVQSWASPDQTKCCKQYKCRIMFNSITCGLLQSHKPQESHNQPHAKLCRLAPFKTHWMEKTQKPSMQLDHGFVNHKRHATQNYLHLFVSAFCPRVAFWIKVDLHSFAGNYTGFYPRKLLNCFITNE